MFEVIKKVLIPSKYINRLNENTLSKNLIVEEKASSTELKEEISSDSNSNPQKEGTTNESLKKLTDNQVELDEKTSKNDLVSIECYWPVEIISVCGPLLRFVIKEY